MALTAGLLLAGCQQQKDASTGAEDAKAPAKQAEAGEKSSAAIAEKDKIAYAIGTNLADSVSGINKEFKSLTMDLEVVKKGFADRLNGESKLTDEEIAQQFQVFQQKMRVAQQQKMEESKAAKLAENETFLSENLTKGFTKTESGLQYKVLEAGKEGAATPAATDKVKVHYTGTFTDGRKFDSSVDRGTPFEFSLTGGVIQGWLEGVKLMSVGSKYQLVIPPELGYGFNDNRSIPGGSILVFDIELLEIIATESKE